MNEETATPPPTRSRAFEVLFTVRSTVAPITVILLAAIAALPNLGVVFGWAFVVVAMLF